MFSYIKYRWISVYKYLSNQINQSEKFTFVMQKNKKTRNVPLVFYQCGFHWFCQMLGSIAYFNSCRMKNKNYNTVGTILKYNTVGTILKSNIKIVERGKIDA